MASPFRNNKKTRKRYRRQAKQQAAWADQNALAGTKSEWSIDAMRRLSASNLRLAQSRSKKSMKRKAEG